LLLPDFDNEARVDLREQLARVRRWLFSIVGLIVLLGITDSALKGRDYFASIWPWQWPLSASLLGMTAIGIIIRAEWVQWVLPLLMLGVFGYFAVHSSAIQ
jgi:hypothetical protein